MLPRIFRPQPCADLVRLGRDNDGGYLVSRADIDATEFLVGLGVNDDWSFEQDFHKLNGCPIVAYDGSVNFARFVKTWLKSLIFINKPQRFLAASITPFSYLRFFRGTRQHVAKFVGLDIGGQNVGFQDILQRAGPRKMFVKCDIEGSEYRILDDLLASADQLTGLVLEVHDCDIHLDRLTRFVAEFPLRLVHIHGNEFAPVSAEGIPLVLELTFSKNGPSGGYDPVLPHPLDQPNGKTGENMILRFTDAD